jgi:hypothetical protein
MLLLDDSPQFISTGVVQKALEPTIALLVMLTEKYFG